jgi:hypothetical protein
MYEALREIEDLLSAENVGTLTYREAQDFYGKIYKIADSALEAAYSAPAPQKQYRIASRHNSSTNTRYSDWVDEVHRGKVEDAAREMMEERSVSVAVAVDIREIAISE